MRVQALALLPMGRWRWGKQQACRHTLNSQGLQGLVFQRVQVQMQVQDQVPQWVQVPLQLEAALVSA